MVLPACWQILSTPKCELQMDLAIESQGSWSCLKAFYVYVTMQAAICNLDFHQLGVGHRVAMSVCLCVCLHHRMHFFSRPLIGPEIA